MINNTASFPLNLSVTFVAVSLQDPQTLGSSQALLSRICHGSRVDMGLRSLRRCTLCPLSLMGWSPHRVSQGVCDCSSSVSYLLHIWLSRVLTPGEEVGISFESPLQTEHEPNSHSKPISGMVYSAKLLLALEIDLCSTGSICYVPALVPGNQRSNRGTLAYLTNTGDSYKSLAFLYTNNEKTER